MLPMCSLCQSSATVQSLGEKATTPVSLPSSDKPGPSVAAPVELHGS